MYWEKGLICFRIAPAWWLVKLKRASLWTNQMKPRSADCSLVRVFPRLAPSYTTSDEFESTTLFLRSGLPSSLIQVNCLPKRMNSVWIWLQFKIPALRFSVNGKLFAERNFLKRLTSPATLLFQIYRHFFARLRQMCGRATFYAFVCTGRKLKQTKNAHSVLKCDKNCTS